MNEHTYPNQSQFSADQAILQPPPELNRRPQSETAKKKQPFKKILVVTGVVFGLFLVFGFVYRTYFYRPAPLVSEVTPSPTPRTEDLNATEKALKDLEDEIQSSDPQTYSYPPPPVDMQITF